MNTTLRNVLGVVGLIVATQAAAEVTFYSREGFHGRSFTTERPVGNFERYGFNDRASSVLVRNGRWQVCEDAHFSGRCVVLRPGRYPTLAMIGLENRVSSVRPVTRTAMIDEGRYPQSRPYDNPYRRD